MTMRIKFDRKDYYTIPNILCYFRIVLVPIFFTFYILGIYNNSTTLKWIGIGAIIAASLTDFVDGKIARKFNQITELGKFLDPLSDKLMQFMICVAIAVAYNHIISSSLVWILLSIFAFKELSQFVFAYILYRKGKWLNGAKWYGKLSTFVFDISMILLMAFTMFSIELEVLKILVSIFITLSIVLLVFAYIMYLIEFAKLGKEKNNITLDTYTKEKNND